MENKDTVHEGLHMVKMTVVGSSKYRSENGTHLPEMNPHTPGSSLVQTYSQKQILVHVKQPKTELETSQRFHCFFKI